MDSQFRTSNRAADERMWRQLQALQDYSEQLQESVDNAVLQVEQVLPESSPVLRRVLKCAMKFRDLKQYLIDSAVNEARLSSWSTELEEFFDEILSCVLEDYKTFKEELDQLTDKLLECIVKDIEDLNNRYEDDFNLMLSILKEQLHQLNVDRALLGSGNITFQEFWQQLMDANSEIASLKLLLFDETERTSLEEMVGLINQREVVQTSPIATGSVFYNPNTSFENQEAIEDLLGYGNQLDLDSDEWEDLEQSYDEVQRQELYWESYSPISVTPDHDVSDVTPLDVSSTAWSVEPTSVRRRLNFDETLDESVLPLSPMRRREYHPFMPHTFEAGALSSRLPEHMMSNGTREHLGRPRDQTGHSWFRENVSVYLRPDGSPALRPRRLKNLEEPPFLGRVILDS